MLPSTPPPPISLEKFAYETIKKAILEFRLKPGDSLVEADLSRQLNISKTPVRDALTRLEREGLVTKVAYTGTYVTEITIQSVLEIFEIRAVLEGLAARQSAANFTEDDLNLCEQILKKHEKALSSGNLAEAASLNRQFHSLILERARNQRLTSILANLDDHLQRFRVLSNYQRGAQTKSVSEHRRVLDALRERNGNSAESAMKQHLQSVLDDLENVDINFLINQVTEQVSSGHARNGFTE